MVANGPSLPVGVASVPDHASLPSSATKKFAAGVAASGAVVSSSPADVGELQAATIVETQSR